MSIISFNACTPSLRKKIGISFTNISKKRPEKALTHGYQRAVGRNSSGRITCRHKGSGHKRRYRQIDFKRDLFDVTGKVLAIEYDPNRSCNIALIEYSNGEKRYILHPEGLNINDAICAGENATICVGNSRKIGTMPLGSYIHNIELYPGKGGQIARAAGNFARVVAKEGALIAVKLSSKEIRLFHKDCSATFGKIGNADYHLQKFGKAGRSRWLGIRPTVRGSAMNAVDHPHGGGEGKCPIGRKRPLTPWGKPTLGVKTRKKNKPSNKYIISTRKI